MSNQTKIDFYNQESTQYSKKRYEGKTESYTQFFFKKRLSIVLDFINYILSKKSNLDLLEIGCADGIVISHIQKTFPNKFSSFVGIDIAESMIEVAKKLNGDPSTSFYVRGNEPSKKYDVILAIGFLSVPMFKKDFGYIEENLKDDGFFLWSLASRNSLHARIKLKGANYISEYASFKEYESFLSKNFEIVKSEPYGLFIPKLWAFPGIARTIQPIIENIFKNIFPSLFHEKVYLLKKKKI
jgi:2-polyprenyl-3-methyl-5-hydroxy-6-metoxy-1,4-benzoquinol methylase